MFFFTCETTISLLLNVWGFLSLPFLRISSKWQTPW